MITFLLGALIGAVVVCAVLYWIFINSWPGW